MCISFYTASYRHLLRLRQPLGQTSLFAVRGILMDNALGNGFIDSGGGDTVHSSGVRRVFSDLRFKLLNGGLDLGLHDAILKVLGFADLHALDSGLDVRQRLSPPWYSFSRRVYFIMQSLKNQYLFSNSFATSFQGSSIPAANAATQAAAATVSRLLPIQPSTSATAAPMAEAVRLPVAENTAGNVMAPSTA